jgi:hypothetical protein
MSCTGGGRLDWYAMTCLVALGFSSDVAFILSGHDGRIVLFEEIASFLGIVCCIACTPSLLQVRSQQASILFLPTRSYRKKLASVSKWLDCHSVPDDTKKMVKDYYASAYVGRGESRMDTVVFGDLPNSLRDSMARCITMDIVSQV